MTARSRPRKLKPTDLRWKCPPAWIPKASKSKPASEPVPGLIGQDRALDALEMGLAVQAPGYNVFVCGISGTEKTDTVHKILEDVRKSCPIVNDHVFVHNFNEPMRPQHLALPAGNGGLLREGMENWVRALQRELPRLLESDRHLRQRQELFRRYTTMEEQLFDRLSKKARSKKLVLVKKTGDDGTSYDLFLKLGDEPVDPEDLNELAEDLRPTEAATRKLLADREVLMTELRMALRNARALGLRLLRESQALDQATVREAVEGLTLETAEEIGANEELAGWLGDCAHYAIWNPELFRRGAAEPQPEREEDSTEDERQPRRRRAGLEIFEVNVVRPSPKEGCPAVYELHPKYSNLFGTVERHVTAGGQGFYHLAVRAGSLLSADGGFLVLNARDVFKEAETWRALKRTLQNGLLETHALEALSPLGVTGVRPEPIPIDLKVVLIGDNPLYETLHDSDFEFPMIFKVKAEFDDTLPLTKNYLGRFVQVLRDVIPTEDLLPFSSTGIQALAERAVRDAGRRNRLSARLSTLLDYARESSYYARQAGKKRVDRTAVETARKRFRLQHSLDADWFSRMVLENVYEISTEGTRIGTVNALTVVGLGPLNFGRPARVSAVVSAGDESYLNIEREVELGGPIHNKGVLILESFMRHRFGVRRTMPMKVALVFDQSYGPIDGDSASSTEVYALVSAVTNTPMRQDIAVTGAVNMIGDVMAVGGVNEKIEGFFELCCQRGLTGTQGVVIPAANLDDLMLESEVVDAVRRGEFHVWAASHVDQVLEMLSGVPTGKPGKDGRYPADTLMGKLEARLDDFEQVLKDKDDGGGDSGSDKAEPAAKAKTPSRKKKSRPADTR